jgi:RNA polymerase sigma-70 factor (ECF subfamily)
MTKSSRLDLAPASGELFDELLVVMAQRGDQRALERLYERWNARLIRAARRYCGGEPGGNDAARDLAQECWLAIWRGIKGLRDPSRFRSYAFAVLHRRGADHLRKVVRERGAAAQRALEPEEPLQAPQTESAAINQAFAALPPDQRLAAHLHFAEGLTLREIAEVQSIPEGTAKSRLFHARRKLKAALSPNGLGDLK